MERMIDDSVKQKLLDSLAEEPTMVISTAYAYAKNYVKYGEDITKEWTTAVQQASIIEKVSLNARVQAHETFRREYENRLRADMVAMLEELKLEFEEYEPKWAENEDQVIASNRTWDDFDDIIQEKINALRGE